MESPDSIVYQKSDETLLEGEIAGTDAYKENADYHTLDEPVKETVLRDLRAVGTKFFHVLYPKQKEVLLKNWDLWGPLILCVFLSAMLSKEGLDDENGGLQFAEVFFIVWIGAVVVTMNSKLLGGNISFFQSVCVLGYCLLPQTISLIICAFLNGVFNSSLFLFIIKTLIAMAGLVWAIWGAYSFLCHCVPAKKQGLALLPVFLFYFFIFVLIAFNFYGA